MRTLIFTEDDRRALSHYRSHHPDPRVQRKVEVLWLKGHGLDRPGTEARASRSVATAQPQRSKR